MELLTNAQVDGLNTCMAALERIARLCHAVNEQVVSNKLPIAPVSATALAMKYHEINQVLEENRMENRRRLSASGLARKVA